MEKKLVAAPSYIVKLPLSAVLVHLAWKISRTKAGTRRERELIDQMRTVLKDYK